MNRVTLVGRTTNDIILRYSDSNKAICKFSLAVQRKFKNPMGEYESDFINCVAFNKTAEVLGQYVKKGDKLGVDGRIQTGSYVNKDGNKVYTTEVAVDSVDFLESKKSSSSPVESGQVNEKVTERDPFTDFGEQVTIDDNFLD